MVPELDTRTLGDHVDRLYRAAWALCGSREDAEDLVQETFARVLVKRRDLGTDDPVPYLITVLRNVYFTSLRTKSRRPQQTPLEDDDADRLAAPASASPAAQVEAREVFAVIGALPDEYRDVIVAVDVAGLSYAEAAETLKVPQGTVMSRLYRGRGKVAEKLRS